MRRDRRPLIKNQLNPDTRNFFVCLGLLTAFLYIIPSFFVYRSSRISSELAELSENAIRSAIEIQANRVKELEERIVSGRRYAPGFPEKTSIEDHRRARELLSRYNSIKLELLQLRFQMKCLASYRGDQLKSYAAELDFPRSRIKDLYPDFLGLKKKIEAEKANGSGNASASVSSNTQELTAMDQQIAEEINGMRSMLQAQIDRTGQELAQLQVIENDPTAEVATLHDLETKEWVGIIKDYESSIARLAELKAIQERE